MKIEEIKQMAREAAPQLTWNGINDGTDRCIIFEGYKKERKRMANVSMRCPHHLSQFDDSQSLALFVFNELQVPLLETPTIAYLTFDQQKRFKFIFDLFGNGMCKGCALALAPMFGFILNNFYTTEGNEVLKCDNIATDTLACICIALLQYPSFAKYYMKYHKSVTCIHIAFVDVCRMNENRGINIFANQLLRNAHLMNSSNHWKETQFLMEYVIKQLYTQMNGYRQMAIWNVISLLLLSFYNHRKDKNEWKKIKRDFGLSVWRKELRKVSHSLENEMFIKICNDLLAITDSTQNQSEGQAGLVKNVQKVWKLKRKNILCARIKCKKKAEQMDNGYLYVCKGCKVARYCSKRCQKKDWKDGKHQIACGNYRTFTKSCFVAAFRLGIKCALVKC